MKAALYARVSTDDQRQAGTIETQVDALKIHAEAKGYEVTDTYLDDGVSGKVAISRRPAGERLVHDAQQGAFERIVVYSLDRLGRNMLNIIMQVERLRRREISVESVKEGFVFDNSPMGGMMLAMLSWAAEFEREQIRERTTRGRAKGREDRRIVNPNGSLYGFDLICRNPKKGQETAYRINEAQAAVVREAFERFITTHPTIRGLAAYLTDESDHPPPKGQKRSGEPVTHRGWGKSTVRNLLSNPAYIGRFYQGRWQTEHLKPVDLDDLDDVGKRRVTLKKDPDEWGPYVEIPRIIDQLTWDKAKRLLATNAERSAHNRKLNYPLSGKVVCGVCWSRMNGLSSRGRRYYRCYHRDRAALKPGEEKCSARDARGEDIEAAAYKLVVKYLTDPQAFVRNKKGATAQMADLKRRLDAVAKNMKDTDRRIRVNFETRESVAATDSERAILDERIAELRKQQDDFESKSKLLTAEQEGLGLVNRKAQEIRRLLPKGAASAKPELMEHFFREYVDHVVVRDGQVADVLGSLLLDEGEREKLNKAVARSGKGGIPAIQVTTMDIDIEPMSLQAVKLLLEDERVAVAGKSY